MPRPPLQLQLAYRLFGWRLGPAWRDWVLHDIAAPGWLFRQGGLALSVVLMLGSLASALVHGDAGKMLSLIVVLAGVGAFLRNSLKERSLRQQGIDADGNRLELAPWYDDDRARRRRNVLSAVGTTVLVLGGLLIVAVRSAP